MTSSPISRTEATALLLAAAEWVVAGAIWRGGPARIATHYGWNGAPDRWSKPPGAAASLAFAALLILALVAALGVGRRRPWADAARRRGLTVAQGLLAFVGAAITLLMASGALTLGDEATRRTAPLLVISLLIAGTGLFLGRVPPNALVGVRTTWSLSSRLAWDKSNRLAGRLMLAAGALGLLAAAWLPLAEATPLVISAVLAAAAASVFESWRVWRTDPEKRAV